LSAATVLLIWSSGSASGEDIDELVNTHRRVVFGAHRDASIPGARLAWAAAGSFHSCGGSSRTSVHCCARSKTDAANERLAQHLWAHRDALLTFLHQPGLDATTWRAELAIRFGVILRKVRGDSQTWAGARAQWVLMSIWRTCWLQGRSALDFLSQLLRGTSAALALPP
jgi:transposase